MKTSNFLTFDIEEWYHANYDGVDISKHSNTDTNLEHSVDRLIELCGSYGVKSTCFILGSVAKAKPYIVKKLHDAGHEIASHGMNHKLIYNMTPDEFSLDLYESTDVLEQITGEKVVGFRAPSWSMSKEISGWFYETLEMQGYRYSSSIYPASNPLFGIPNANRMPHMVGGILEIPQSIMSIAGYECGYAGGGFFRFFPRWLIEREIKKANKEGRPVFLYLHPREIEPDQPKLDIRGSDKFFHYYGINGCEAKLTEIVGDFKDSFVRMDKYRLY